MYGITSESEKSPTKHTVAFTVKLHSFGKFKTRFLHDKLRYCIIKVFLLFFLKISVKIVEHSGRLKITTETKFTFFNAGSKTLRITMRYLIEKIFKLIIVQFLELVYFTSRTKTYNKPNSFIPY